MFGLALRSPHYQTILETKPKIDFLEILSENYFIPGGKPLYYLDALSEHYPLVMHGVGLSIGSVDPISWDYLKQIKNLAKRIKTLWISDHFSWTHTGNIYSHDLLPLPYTEETIHHVVQRLKEVQDFLEQAILLENVSTYMHFKESTYTEWECLNAIAAESGCKILLDINNIFLSDHNLGLDPRQFILGLNKEYVGQLHLAGVDRTWCQTPTYADWADWCQTPTYVDGVRHHGQSDGEQHGQSSGRHHGQSSIEHRGHLAMQNFIVDTHDAKIPSEVWDLYALAVQKLGPVPTIIERDGNIPDLCELLEELEQAKRLVSDTKIGVTSFSPSFRDFR